MRPTRHRLLYCFPARPLARLQKVAGLKTFHVETNQGHVREDQPARDMLQLIRPDGIDTRTLARRTGLARSLAVQMLDWLREERFLETRDGIHYPGELSSSSDTAPAVTEQTPFGLTAHARAVGKSLLAQRNFVSRMDHLSQYPLRTARGG